MNDLLHTATALAPFIVALLLAYTIHKITRRNR